MASRFVDIYIIQFDCQSSKLTKAAALMDGDRFPTDVLSEIHRRLPPMSGRRRLRLVCQHWWDTIDDCDNL
jgi:F-box domain.